MGSESAPVFKQPYAEAVCEGTFCSGQVLELEAKHFDGTVWCSIPSYSMKLAYLTTGILRLFSPDLIVRKFQEFIEDLRMTSQSCMKMHNNGTQPFCSKGRWVEGYCDPDVCI